MVVDVGAVVAAQWTVDAGGADAGASMPGPSMKRLLTVSCAVVLLCTTAAAEAQRAAAERAAAEPGLVSSWTLAAVERGIAADQPTRVPGARGLLIIDSVGHVFEFFSTASRDQPESPRLDPQRTFTDFGGFWGHYEVVPAAARIDFEAESGVSPDLEGLAFSRAYELDGDRLVMTSTDEPQAQGDTRWTWQRVPTVELTPTYRQVVGFWRHIDERRINTATGEAESIRERAPSVIVYAPSGYFGVHFPTLGRVPFAGPTPTREEAEEAYRTYLGYYGALGVYPGEVAHNVLSGVQPSAGAILRRSAEITGDELVVTLQTGAARASDAPPPFVTTVHLRRLSGLDEMLPR